jgi:hypothetical protein
LVTGAAVTLLISAYALWVQFRGPLHEHNVLERPWSGNLALFVDPSSNLLFHTPASEAVIAHYNHTLPEILAYLGWPLIVVLVVAAVRFWRDPRVRAAAVTCAALEVCNLGGGPLPIGGFRLSGQFLPYHWLMGLPVMSQVIPPRFCILGAGAAGAVLAFSLDLARAAVPQERAWQRRIPVAVALLAVMPLIPLPYRTAPVQPVPAGWQAAFSRLRLPQDARVLVVPIPLIGATATAPMSWQADTGEPRSLIGGYFLGPSPTGQGVFSIGPTQYAARYLNRLWSGRAASFRRDALVRSALAYWRPACWARPPSASAGCWSGGVSRPREPTAAKPDDPRPEPRIAAGPRRQRGGEVGSHPSVSARVAATVPHGGPLSCPPRHRATATGAAGVHTPMCWHGALRIRTAAPDRAR